MRDYKITILAALVPDGISLPKTRRVMYTSRKREDQEDPELLYQMPV